MRYGSEFEIVHRDIKLGNGKQGSHQALHWYNSPIKPVLLGYENADKGFPFYPVAKLGDFGVATMTYGDDTKNPAEYKGWGTPGYMAPVSMRSSIYKGMANP